MCLAWLFVCTSRYCINIMFGCTSRYCIRSADLYKSLFLFVCQSTNPEEAHQRTSFIDLFRTPNMRIKTINIMFNWLVLDAHLHHTTQSFTFSGLARFFVYSHMGKMRTFPYFFYNFPIFSLFSPQHSFIFLSLFGPSGKTLLTPLSSLHYLNV